MRARMFGVLLIIAGIIGWFLPVIPGNLLIIVGVLTFYSGREGKIRRILPERLPHYAAKLYNRFVTPALGPIYKQLAADVAQHNPGTILDIGTGPGLLPVAIAEACPSASITGIDLSHTMIAMARVTAGQRKNLTFAVMDGNRLAFPDNAFDFIVSTSSLHHWKNPAIVFDEIHRCLKPGGEAWVFDGFADVGRIEVDASLKPEKWGWAHYRTVLYALKIHGFTRKEYDTEIREAVAISRFRSAEFIPRSIMMQMVLTKKTVWKEGSAL